MDDSGNLGIVYGEVEQRRIRVFHLVVTNLREMMALGRPVSRELLIERVSGQGATRKEIECALDNTVTESFHRLNVSPPVITRN